jgi:hypothetical protein
MTPHSGRPFGRPALPARSVRNLSRSMYGAPVWYLRRSGAGDMFDTYSDSFSEVWVTATPAQQDG